MKKVLYSRVVNGLIEMYSIVLPDVQDEGLRVSQHS